jgi:hypothetical protein
MKLITESFEEYVNEKYVGFLEIPDIQTYTKEMSKGVEDKISFISKINPDCIVDFGCADGYVLDQIRKKYPNIKELIGYDTDDKMIGLAKSKFPELEITNNWKEVIYKSSEHDNIALTLMSVIHEIYSYTSGKNVHDFWKNQVFNPRWKWVIIRDMIISKQYMNLKPEKQEIKKINTLFNFKYYQNFSHRKSFEKNWGKITDSYRNLFHWLLKYDYKRNWSREVLENYFPVSIETIKSKIPIGWNIISEDHYIYEPIANKIKKDWGINLKYPTHLKMIIENTNANR